MGKNDAMLLRPTDSATEDMVRRMFSGPATGTATRGRTK